MSHFSTAEGSYELRQRLYRSMPAEAFEPVPGRGVAALVQVPIYLLLAGLVVSGALPAWTGPVVGLIIGQLVTSVALLAHETLHRSTFRSRAMQLLVGWLGFAWFFITPGTWHAWHVRGHHMETHRGAADPDERPTLAAWRASRCVRLMHAFTPGSRTVWSYVSPAFLFVLQAQAFVWWTSGEQGAPPMNRPLERLGTLALFGGWAAVCTALGPWNSLCVVGIPMVTANATLTLYLATQHALRPLTPAHNNPFTNSASVIVHPVLDWMHHNTSYHQEHHIFPQMSPKWAPLLRHRLRKAAPAAVCAWPIGAVWHQLYTTPALYKDDHTLVHADGSGAVGIEEIAHRMKPAARGAELLAPR